MRYSQISDALTQSLSLHQPPVALCFAESIPSGVRNFSGRVPAGCRFWEEAARGAFATSATDHNLCAIGVYTHNLETSEGQQKDLMDVLAVFKQLGYVRDEDVPSIPVLQTCPRYVIYSPLSETPLPPDLVLLFIDADQALVLCEATGQVESQTSPAMGRPACAVVPQVVNTGRAAVSFGCCGARAYLDNLNNGTVIFGIPGAKLDQYASRVESFAKANSVLTKFHQLRRRDIEAGQRPTIKESLIAFGV